ncbi:MAG: YsnF/AvaK domain-containing protein, partial [Thermomicrobiales bacterium]
MAYQPTEIPSGADVFGADGEKVGIVAAAYPGYIVVEKGFFFPTDYYIPMNAIAGYDGGRINLNVSKDTALQSGWDSQPVDLESAVSPTDLTTDAAMSGAARPGEVVDEGELRIPVMEEELTATVREQEAGAVRIAKDVITEERTLDVPVTEERVRVERHVVDRPVTAADAETFTDTVIEVPVRSEVVDVDKQARVAEEVVVSKEAVEHTERVRDTVRKERVRVNEDETVDPRLIEG